MYTPALNSQFNLAPISMGQLALIAVTSLLIVSLLELRKYLIRV
jgi:hypothetical protein